MKYLGKQSIFDDLMIGGVLLTPPDPATYAYELTLPNDDGTSGQVLQTDGNGVLSWVTHAGAGGTVTSVAVSGGSTGLTTSGGPITTSGTITIGGTLAVGSGGTGVGTVATDNILTGNGTSPLTAESTLTYNGSQLTHTMTPSGNFTGYAPTATTGTGWATGTNTGYGILNTFDKDDNTNAAGVNTYTSIYNDINDTASDNRNLTQLIGTSNYISLANDAASGVVNSWGTINNITNGDSQYGVQNILTGGAAAATTYGIYQKIDDGGHDLYFLSSDATTVDYFSLVTKASGATDIITVDGGGSAADLTLDIDGDITFDAFGKQFNFGTGGTNTVLFDLNASNYKFMALANQNDYFNINVGAEGATTISTVDADTAVAHLNFTIDGLTKFTSLGVEIENASATGVPALLIDNDDVDQHALSIVAANTTVPIINIDASTLTTGQGIRVYDDSYERAAGHIHIDVTDTQTTTLDRAGNGLFRIDYDRPGGSPVASGQTNYAIGAEIKMDNNATNVGVSSMTGMDIVIDHASTGGIATSAGIDIDISGGDGGTGMTIDVTSPSAYGIIMLVTDGGNDIVCKSSANTLDVFSIKTGTNAETTLKTFDQDAALAHLNFVVDGNITLDAVGDIEINADSGAINFKDDSASLAKISTAGLSFENNTGAGIIFDGATDNAHMTTLSVIDPTGTRAVNLPNESGTVALTSDIPDEVAGSTHIHKQTKVTFDQAACNAINGGTVASRTLVAAQGANQIIVPVSVTVLVDRNSADTSAADLIVGYNGTTSYTYAIKYLRRFMYGILTDMTFLMTDYLGKGAASLTGGENVALTISTSAAISSNSLTSMTVYTSYYVIDNS